MRAINLRRRLALLTRKRVAEPSFGIFNLSAALGKKVVLAHLPAKHVTKPAVTDQTKLR